MAALITRIDLSGDASTFTSALGLASDAVVGGTEYMVFDLGRNALDPRLLGVITRWWRRHAPYVRARVTGVAFVIPGFFARLQHRLSHWLESPHVPWKITSTAPAADAWIHRHKLAK
jgi:hypothetical protein